MTDAKGYRGYIGSRAYRYGNYPQQVQNLIIRTFCQNHQLTFLLSATEYAIPGCFMMLEEVINSLEAIEGIVLFSIFMLPEAADKRMRLYKKILASGRTLYAALEDLSIKNEQDIQAIEDIWRIYDIIPDEKLMLEIDNRECIEG